MTGHAQILYGQLSRVVCWTHHGPAIPHGSEVPLQHLKMLHTPQCFAPLTLIFPNSAPRLLSGAEGNKLNPDLHFTNVTEQREAMVMGQVWRGGDRVGPKEPRSDSRLEASQEAILGSWENYGRCNCRWAKALSPHLMHVPLPLPSSLTKHKWKENIFKNFRMTNIEH